MADELELNEVLANDRDKEWLPLSLRKIMCNEYIDHQIPYKKMFDHSIAGRVYGQHGLRRTSPIVNFKGIEHLILTEGKHE